MNVKYQHQKKYDTKHNIRLQVVLFYPKWFISAGCIWMRETNVRIDFKKQLPNHYRSAFKFQDKNLITKNYA